MCAQLVFQPIKADADQGGLRPGAAQRIYTWMFIHRGTNHKVNRLHARSLRISYKDYLSSYDEA